MKKQFFAGVVCGMLLLAMAGYVYLSLTALNNRVNNIEKFLNTAVQQSQQAKPTEPKNATA